MVVPGHIHDKRQLTQLQLDALASRSKAATRALRRAQRLFSARKAARREGQGMSSKHSQIPLPSPRPSTPAAAAATACCRPTKSGMSRSCWRFH
jgi:hypothetical protein